MLPLVMLSLSHGHAGMATACVRGNNVEPDRDERQYVV